MLCTCERVCAEIRGGVGCPILSLSSYSFEAGSPTELGAELKLAAPAIPLSLLPSQCHKCVQSHLALDVGAGDWISGAHACSARTLAH